MMKTAAAAALLGIPVREVTSVASSPAGDVITTHDGVAYLLAAVADAEGKTGLMLLAAPSEASLVAGDPETGTITTWNGFPVFASDELTEAPADGEPPAGPAGDVVDDGLEALTLDELKVIAADLDVQAAGRSNHDKHASLVAGIRAKRAEPACQIGVAQAAIAAELDELTDAELAERAEHLGVDVVDDRDDLIASIAATIMANGAT